MAGEWIKIRIDLTDDPTVFMLADLLSTDCPTIVGHLVTFWAWMDRHTPDGKHIQLTENVIDRKIAMLGFANAMRKVGWLAGEDGALELPNFERHNGASSKARALESEAKRLRRQMKTEGENIASETPKKNVGQVSDKTESKSPTREEKRREEKNTDKDKNLSVLTNGDDSVQKAPDSKKPTKPELITKRKRKLTGSKLMAFELFWIAFDYKKDRASAADAWLDLEMDQDLFDVIIRSAKQVAAGRPMEIQANRTPIYPQGWLSGRRWEDEPYVGTPRVIDHPGRSGKIGASTLERFTDRSWAVPLAAEG